MQTKNAVAYVRVSTSTQDCSLELQQERVASYCKLMGLTLIETLVENDVSGKTRIQDRPAGSRIAGLLQSGACHVVALKLDRLFRNAADALLQTEEWQQQGVSLHLIDMGGQSINTASSMGKMMLTVLAGFAEFERSCIVDRTTAALRFKRAAGRVFNHAPYGFDAQAGMLVSNPEEQAAVASMRALRASGVSYRRIADDLMNRRVRTKTGRTWHAQTVKSILAA